ncbi:MAG TPA: L,D-transpeptidase [Candidatus Saccharimonadales bacterium]|jgi:hypothetical protein|nr:L,D-transpeptidase [Candidatus Saccharimonadales bacterium]
MRTSTLANKTVRPGLMNYSFYASSRRAPTPPQPAIRLPRFKLGAQVWPLIVTLAVVGGVFIGLKSISSPSTNTANNSATSMPPIKPAPATAAITTNQCAGNSLAQFIKVSISQRHLWACQGTKAVYDSPVVTGMEAYAADKTPTGTYQIADKQTNTTLTGSDSTGAWSDPVHYWMPFLSNQYGVYGFHDATWRPDSAFGHIDPNSNQASHGCVELPLATSAWLYNWAQVGTTVTIST